MRYILLLIISFSLSTMLVAQLPPHPGDGNGGGPSPGDPPVGAPIEGGIIILIALAAGYGSKKTYNARKETKTLKRIKENEE